MLARCVLDSGIIHDKTFYLDVLLTCYLCLFVSYACGFLCHIIVYFYKESCVGGIIICWSSNKYLFTLYNDKIKALSTTLDLPHGFLYIIYTAPALG